jgi:hypothetical protein
VPIAAIAQKEETLSITSCLSSSRASLITRSPTDEKTIKTTQALKGAIHSYIANPTSQPNRGSNAVDIENAAAILPALTIKLLRVPPGINRLKAKARPKSSKDNPKDSKMRAK